MRRLSLIRLKQILHNQQGQVIIIALVLLGLISLMIGPLVNFISSGLKQGTALEERTDQTYIADAGIEVVCHKILTGTLGTPDLIDPHPVWNFEILNVNYPGSHFQVIVTLILNENNSQKYLLTSTGYDQKGESTKIEAEITTFAGDYYSFLNNVGTTNGNIQLPPAKNSIIGNIQSANVPDPDAFISGGYAGPYNGEWPDSNTLISFYTTKLQNQDMNGYHNGNWTINSEYTINDSIGVEYVNGDLQINADLHLNGKAVFVTGQIDSKPGTSVFGPGVVASLKDIKLNPKNEGGGPTSGIFIFSLGNIDIQPSGEFYGWVAGKGSLTIRQGNDPLFAWAQPEFSYPLNFPGLYSGGPDFPAGGLIISRWEIINQ